MITATRISDPELEELIVTLHNARAMKRSSEEKEDEVLPRVRELAHLYQSEMGTNKFVVGDFKLSLVPGVNRRIVREKLLERGVSPEIIAYATAVTEYESVRLEVQ